MVTIKNAEITALGVRIGLHAGSSCCVNFEYLGLLLCLLVVDGSLDPAVDVAMAKEPIQFN